MDIVIYIFIAFIFTGQFCSRNEIGGRLCYTSSVGFWTWLKFLEEVLCYYLSSISRMVYLNLHVLIDFKDADAENGQWI